jgi:hypothetical protein
MEEIMEEEKKEKATVFSRRNLLKGSAAVVLGGIAGRLSTVSAATGPQYAPAPPLPWKWIKLDPLEAGRRTYRAYLKNKG